MLNSRETATLIWLSIAVVAAVVILAKQPGGGNSLRSLAASMVQWKVLVVAVSTALYVALVVFAAWRIGLWAPDLLPPTLIWGLPATYALGFLALKATKEEHFFRSRLKEALGVALVLEVLVNLETFPLWWELIQVPVITLVVLLEAVATLREEHAPARTCLGFLVALIGFALLAATVIRFVQGWAHHDWPSVARSVGLGLWLPLSALPLVYFWSVAMLYGTLWVRLRFQATDRRLPWWRKAGVLAVFRLRRGLLLHLSHAERRELARTRDLRDTLRTAQRLVQE